MGNFLTGIRPAVDGRPARRKLIAAALVFLLGVGLGILSKYLDENHAELPEIFWMLDEQLDLHNFLGGLSPWIVLAVSLAAYSKTPAQAAAHVFVFFVGMVGSYYLYSKYIAGFFPRHYAMIWFGLTAVSPVLAVLCWYARGTGKTAVILSACILAVLINTAFAYGFFYVSVRSALDLAMLIIGIFVLRRSPGETGAMLCGAVPIAVALHMLLPFSLG